MRKKIQKIRIAIESKTFNYVISPQFLDKDVWKPFPDEYSPKSISVPKAKFHGNEIIHLSNNNIKRGLDNITKWLMEWKKTYNPSAVLVEGSDDRKKIVKKHDKAKDSDPWPRCDKCGRMVRIMTTPRPDIILCINCR